MQLTAAVQESDLSDHRNSCRPKTSRKRENKAGEEPFSPGNVPPDRRSKGINPALGMPIGARTQKGIRAISATIGEGQGNAGVEDTRERGGNDKIRGSRKRKPEKADFKTLPLRFKYPCEFRNGSVKKRRVGRG
ncbi:hypothetical protein GW17_00025841 [Ensete ventricosum]|nr:hypothetical protein GW17_00025841 [Ensete ventricosum]RZS24853.1 hypothetical protein BHM03_00057970 [Ensete ventricosum]